MRTRWIAVAACVAIGLVWVGQGLGWIRGTGFMTGDVRWAVAGGGLFAIGVVIGWASWRGRSRA